MSKKRRVTLKLKDDEAAVIAPLIFWSSLENLFRDLGKEFPEDQSGWQDAIDLVSRGVEKTKSRQLDM